MYSAVFHRPNRAGQNLARSLRCAAADGLTRSRRAVFGVTRPGIIRPIAAVAARQWNLELSIVLSPWSRSASGPLLGEPSGSPTPDERRRPTPAPPRGPDTNRPVPLMRHPAACAASEAARETFGLFPWKHKGVRAMSRDAADLAAESSPRPFHAELSVRSGIQGIAHAFPGTTSIAGRGGRRDTDLGMWRRAVVGTNSPRLRTFASDRAAAMPSLTMAATAPVRRCDFLRQIRECSRWPARDAAEGLSRRESGAPTTARRTAALHESHVRPARDHVLVSR